MKEKNCAIHCTTQNCQYNLGTENYCTLNSIQVGSHENCPQSCQCVDCQSFVPKNK